MGLGGPRPEVWVVRKWLHWAWLGACAAAVGVGCGSSGGSSQGFAPTDDGGSSTSSGSSSGTSGSSSSSSSSSSGTSSGDDATTSSSSSGGGPVDASLDIAFPDAFYGPDTGSGSSGGLQDAGSDGPQCFPDGITCQNGVAYTCKNGVQTTQSCGGSQCVNGFGCIVCQPGTGSCSGNVGTACNASGTGYVTNDCDPLQGESCNQTNGQCTGDCASVGESYIGCEYYAVTMSNEELDQTVFPFSVSISNTTSKTATITITGPSYNQQFTLAAGAIQNYQLPWVSSLSCQGGTCNGTALLTPKTVLVAGGAYHIRSTEPVTVYEFNSYDYQLNVSCGSDPNGSPPCHSYTNDASLLIPVNAMTGNYRVLAGATWGFNNGGSIQVPGNAVIVGTANGTKVTFTMAKGSIQAGAGLGASGGTVTLNQGDVLEISSAQDAPEPGYGSDMSGSLISATQPVEVIGGSDCSFVPASNWACDHLEQINFPLETLRGDYLVTVPFNNNGDPNANPPIYPRQYVKIVGTAANTVLTTSPAQAGVPSTIGAGQVVWFETTQDFRLTSSAPVIVGQFMEGQYQFDGACNQPGLAGPPDCGDPSMSLAVATSQFRTSYQFIAPPSYYENWVNVIAPTTATVTVDGKPVTGYSAIGNSGYQVAHVQLCGPQTTACSGSSGIHSTSGTAAFGIEVYGYGYFTSYMYPGGLNLTRQ